MVSDLKKLKIFFWMLPLFDMVWVYIMHVIGEFAYIGFYGLPVSTGMFVPLWLRMVIIIKIIVFFEEYGFLFLICKIGDGWAKYITLILATLHLSYFLYYLFAFSKEPSLNLRVIGVILTILGVVPFYYFAYYLRERIKNR